MEHKTQHPGQALNPRIVLCANTAWNIANFRSGLVRALIHNGYEVHVVAPADAHANSLTDLGCQFHHVEMDNKGTSVAADLKLLVRLRKILGTIQPQAFLGFTIKPNVYGSLAAQSLGIQTVNNISGLGTAFIKDTFLTRVVKTLYRFSLKRSSRVFFQNEDDQTLFINLGLVRAAKTDLLPGSGIDLDHYKPAPLPQNPSPTFLLIARLLWDKGVGEFVDAARTVRAKYPDARFQLLGFLDVANRTAVPADKVDDWVREGVVEYLGTTSDVREMIANCDCVVLPSYREGTPRTLLEAAAMGRPLIATDVPGCRDVVMDGVNGFLAMVRDCDDLALQFEKFIGAGHETKMVMGEESRKLVETRYSEQFVIQKYLKLLGSLRQPDE